MPLGKCSAGFFKLRKRDSTLFLKSTACVHVPFSCVVETLFLYHRHFSSQRGFALWPFGQSVYVVRWEEGRRAEELTLSNRTGLINTSCWLRDPSHITCCITSCRTESITKGIFFWLCPHILQLMKQVLLAPTYYSLTPPTPCTVTSSNLCL